MGRKRKAPVAINSSIVRTEISPNDGLPPFQKFIDITYERHGKQGLTRLFFVTPNSEEIDDTVNLRNRVGTEWFRVIGGLMPYMASSTNISLPLFEFCVTKGFSEDFSASLIRLIINDLESKHLTYSPLNSRDNAIHKFVDFLSTYIEEPSQLTLADIGKQVWMDYLQVVEADVRVNAENLFNYARGPFISYSATALGGWLEQVRFAKRKRNPSQEHTSELVDASYPDAVMYQILALCLEGFQRRIGYLKRYDSLTEADMPADWLYPGRDNQKPANGAKRRHLKKGETQETESFVLLSKWLKDVENGFRILIDHFIMHHKAGVLKRNKHGGLGGGIAGSLDGLALRDEMRPLVQQFWNTTALWHGFTHGTNRRHILHFYVKKVTAREPNVIINQIVWCLANLLMMQTGVNKEVALSIPSKGEDGRSILLRGDTVFFSSNGEPTDAELYGFKARTGDSRNKVIPIPIVKESPLYGMLVDYERYVKVDFDGPFFEVDKTFKTYWSQAGRIIDFTMVYPIVDESGKLISSIDTTKFRKVFASGQLLDRIQGIKDGNDLAERLREDLNHGNLDVTLTHYLLKSNVSRSVIDTAIATITSEKLAEAIRFRGKIALSKGTPVKKRVFLCDCEDPTNPSHDVAIAAECKHYDLCLGCERSVITQFHLPYICARILQYEEVRRADPHIWVATLEDRWNIAHDALDQYAAKDKKNGKRLVDESWSAANEGRISLPPIIVSNRM